MELKYFFVENKEWASYNHNGELISRHRTERVKHVDDDLPKISTAYKNFGGAIMKCGTITMHSIIGSNRIDPSYHLSDAIWFRNLQNKLPYGNVHIKNVVEKVFLGNIFFPNLC